MKKVWKTHVPQNVLATVLIVMNLVVMQTNFVMDVVLTVMTPWTVDQQLLAPVNVFQIVVTV